MNIIAMLNPTPETTSREKAAQEARQILRLFRCSMCCKFLNDPITLSCGTSYCRQCLKARVIHTSYTPATALRFTCPINTPNCRHNQPHLLGGLKGDVTLHNLTDICRKLVSDYFPSLIEDDCEEDDDDDDDDDDDGDFRVLGAYMKSNSDDELPIARPSEYGWNISPEVFNTLKNLMLPELDCKVCTEIFIDPITTPCGHTFCKSCITRSLDHSDKCPLCRHPLTNYAFFQHHPINKTIHNLLQSFYTELCKQRQTALEHELYHNMQETPIFVCSLVFPRMPCFIHVFEPRYRLMIRRCLESRQRRFGMVLPDRNGQGYCDYGTMLEIRSIEFLPDGRSLIETIGSYRFRVIERGMRDGYHVGKIERIDDLDPEEEEELERKAIARAQLNNANPNNPRIEEPTTAELIATAREFIESLRNGSAWILQRLNSTYGEMPDNPAGFSFWVATVIPIDPFEKAKLLEIRSVRERLKLINYWINQLRRQWWFARGGCTIS